MRPYQVLVWKTNFDRVTTHNKLHSKQKAARPHTTHTHQQRISMPDSTHHFDATRLPRDHVTPPLDVVDVGPKLFHKSEPTMSSMGQGASMFPEPHTSNTAPLEPISMPPQLSNTLEHIVGQLDVLTQVNRCTNTVACTNITCTCK